MARQLVESGTRVGADCRACARATSGTEFTQRVLALADRTDEAVFWIELVLQSGMTTGPEAAELLDEAKQLKAIMAASAKTVRTNSNVAVNRR